MTGATHARPRAPQTRSPRFPLTAVLPSGRWLPTAAAAVAVFGLAFNGASFGVMTRNPIAIGLWWLLALGVALSLLPVARIPKAALGAGGLLAAFVALVGVSVAWADSSEGAFDDFTRGTLYLGVFALGVLAVRRGDTRRITDGLAIGIAAVALLALVARLFPNLIEAARPVGAFKGDVRPSWPINYWNGLAVFTALAIPGLLRLASDSRRAVGALALAPVPALLALIYLTSSRTGLAAVAVGVLCFVLLTADRTRAVIALALAGLGSVAAIAALSANSAIVDGPLDTSAASREGRVAAIAILVACLVTAGAQAMTSRWSIRVPPIPPRWRRPLAVVAAVVVVAGVVAADPAARLDSFKQPPPQLGEKLSDGSYASSHLLSGGSSGRWQFWSAAVDEWKEHRVVGGGSGSYGAWWAEHGQISYVTRDAHSLYLEALAELGPLGLGLLIALLALAGVTGWRRVRTAARDQRPAVAAAVATFAAFAVAAGLDWMWELPAVTAVGVLALALVTGPATGVEAQAAKRRGKRYILARLGFVGVALAIVVSQMIPLLAQSDIQSSQSAAGRGDVSAALSRAHDARDWQPWAASPRLQEALVQEQAGHLQAARTAIEAAIARDRSDWHLWIVAARIDARMGARAAGLESLAEAKRLNPRSKAVETSERELNPVLKSSQ